MRCGGLGWTADLVVVRPAHALCWSLCLQVFDILPIRSYLRPGETDMVEFVFYGHPHQKFRATAVCEVRCVCYTRGAIPARAVPIHAP